MHASEAVLHCCLLRCDLESSPTARAANIQVVILWVAQDGLCPSDSSHWLFEIEMNRSQHWLTSEWEEHLLSPSPSLSLSVCVSPRLYQSLTCCYQGNSLCIQTLQRVMWERAAPLVCWMQGHLCAVLLCSSVRFHSFPFAWLTATSSHVPPVVRRRPWAPDQAWSPLLCRVRVKGL